MSVRPPGHLTCPEAPGTNDLEWTPLPQHGHLAVRPGWGEGARERLGGAGQQFGLQARQ